jgi:hypothetical protein
MFAKLVARPLASCFLDHPFFVAAPLPALVLLLVDLARGEAALSESIGLHAVGIKVAFIPPQTSPPRAVPFVQAISGRQESFADKRLSFQEKRET